MKLLYEHCEPRQTKPLPDKTWRASLLIGFRTLYRCEGMAATWLGKTRLHPFGENHLRIILKWAMSAVQRRSQSATRIAWHGKQGNGLELIPIAKAESIRLCGASERKHGNCKRSFLLRWNNRGYVFCFFFFAEGNNTLLRISR